MYGHLNSGKTYSMGLRFNDFGEENGLAPRILGDIFKFKENKSEDICTIRCGYVHLFNNEMIDLLTQKKVENGRTCKEQTEAYECLKRGKDFLATGHRIFSISLFKFNSCVISAKLNLIDLATFEKADNSPKHSLVNDNITLLTLRNVFSTLGANYNGCRDSKLTTYVKDTIGSRNSQILLIACTSLYNNVEEVLSKLRFSKCERSEKKQRKILW